MSLGRRDFLKMTAASAAMMAAAPAVLKNNAFAMNPAKNQASSDVSFVGSSSAGTRKKMLADVLEPWRSAITAGITGKTILIKPNMVYWNTSITSPALSLTHVDAVRALIEFLRTISATVPIIVGECSAGTLSSMWTSAGYNTLPTEYTGVTLMDLNDTTKMPSVTRHLWTTAFTEAAATANPVPITSAFVDPQYYVISICRPKSHNCMVMTGVNKNMLMGAPLNSATIGGKSVCPKQYMHGQNGWYSGTQPNEDKCLAYNLFQIGNVIFSAGSPSFAVLDAWEGMEGEGPIGGTSVMQYCAVAGIDSLAVDRLCAKLMGFSDTAIDPVNKATPSYTDMRALVWLSNAGYGNYDLSKINFILGSLTALQPYIKSYKLAVNYTGSPSYETEWTTSGSAPSKAFDLPTDSIGTSRYLDPKPYLAPQMHKTISSNELKIEFSLPVAFTVHLGIYNMQGVEVCKLGSDHLQAGRYTMVWNRKNSAGARVPSGHYIIKMSFDSRSLCDHVDLVN